MHINNVKPIVPDQLGWLEAKLSQECIDRLWLYIKNHNKISAKNVLAGNISSSFYLNDEDKMKKEKEDNEKKQEVFKVKE